MKSFLALSAENAAVVRDQNGVPVEWVLLREGDNELCREGIDQVLHLSKEDLQSIINYHTKKGELIPIDSEHYLYLLAEQKKVDEEEALKLFPDGAAALGFGTLVLDGSDLRIRVRWQPSAYEFLKEGIFKYFSPVIRGIDKGPVRVTSVAMTNTPAINHLDALAARAENISPGVSGRKAEMSKLEKALSRLLGRDSLALGAENDKEKDSIACEIEEKAGLIEQIKTLLGLEEDASIDEIIAALKAEAEKAGSADEKQKEIDELKTREEEKAHADLIEKGKAEGKITDEDLEYVNTLDSKALSAHLAHTGVKVPVAKTAVPARREGALALSAEDRTAIGALKHLGITEEEYLKAKNERAK